MFRIRCSQPLSGDCTWFRRQQRQQVSYFEGCGIPWLEEQDVGTPGSCTTPPFSRVVSMILERQVWLIQNKDDNTTFTLWRYPNSYYVCMVILNSTRLENLSWSFLVFRLSDPSIWHSTVNFFYVILITKDELEIAHLVAVDHSHAVFSCNMKNILNLSFHWEDKLIELLGFHSL